MGLLDNVTQQEYYQGSDFGNYQFTSLDDIINQFIIAYVGEDKVISKIKRTDVAFHAQRALQELSFDTFKSIKAQEIVVPSTLQMILPHDYVNYTKISWSDAAGIKHRLYPTLCNTSNPFSILQDSDGNYDFPVGVQLAINPDFEEALGSPWFSSPIHNDPHSSGLDSIGIVDGALAFEHYAYWHWSGEMSRAYATWQAIDVTGINLLEISATGTSAPALGTAENGVLYFGISSVPGDIAVDATTQTGTYAVQTTNNIQSNNVNPPDLGYVEWIDGTSSSKQLIDTDAVDVSAYDTVYIIIKSYLNFTGLATPNTSTTQSANTTSSTNSIDDIVVTSGSLEAVDAPGFPLAQKNNTGHSETWKNYKSGTPSENQSQYDDDTYWPMNGSRYGLDPQHAQANGSFFIDQRLGKIHFSSNISGKTLVLDYISDSLGTDGEMQVHKFAEEAMYKHILCGIMSARANVGRNQLLYYKKDKFAAIRTAKLRLSNIKLEEITQILRGKSKHIKH